jgi:plasmid maintenance system antidote protein VapI
MASLGDLIVKIGGNIDGFRDAMKEGGELADGFGEKILELGLEIVGITSVFEGLKESIEVSAQIESVTVALAAFTGSAEKAAQALEVVEEIAQSSALSLTDAIPAAQHMMALGFSIESTAATMRAAADAAWALGVPVEDVSQRIAQIGMSGMVSERMLRTMGLSLSDLGRVMGISKNDVKAAMEGMDEATRVAVMDMAIEQSKMAGTAEKEAETISGQWTLFKNIFHQDFKEVGDDLKEITGFFLRFGTTVAQVLGDLFSNLPGVDPLKGMLEVIGSGLTSLRERGNLTGTKSFAEVSAEQRAPKFGEKGRFAGPTAEAENAEGKDPHAAALKALAGKQAKEAAGPALVRNTSADQEAVRAADLARKTAAEEIEAKHSAIVAENNLIQDGFARSQAAAAEEIRLAEEKKTRIGAIDQQEHDQRVKLLQQRESLEKAAKFEKDPAVNSQKQQEVHAEVTGKIAALDGKLAEQQIALDATVSKAVGKSNEDESNQLRQLGEQTTREWEKAYAAKQKLAQKTFIEQNAPGAFNTLANQASEEILAKGKGQTDAEAIQTNKIALERAYGLEVVHTQAERLSFERQIADFDAQARNAKIAGLQKELELAATAMADSEDGSEKQVSDAKRVAELYNQIAQARAQANNADSAAQSKLAIEKNNQTLGAQIKGQFGDGSALDKSKVATAHLVKDSVDGIASALARAAVQGKGLGQIFSQLGKQLAISALTSALKIGLESGLKALTPLATAALAAVLKLIPAFGAVATAQAAAAATKKAVESAAAAASVTSAAGEGAAWGFESVMAALPFPVNVAVAPVVAATTFAQIMGFGAPAAFAEGGEPPLGVPSLVGERGPELFIPHQLGTIIPNHQLKAFASSGGSASSISSSSSSASQTNNFNIAGANSPRETARAVAQYLKTASPQFSRFAH